jgi:hypothetical protein
MKTEIHKLRKMYLLIPTIGIDAEFRCVFFAWFRHALYIGKGKGVKK